MNLGYYKGYEQPERDYDSDDKLNYKDESYN